MIQSIEELLSAYNADPYAKVSIAMESGGYFFNDSWGASNLELEPEMAGRLHNLGIIYIYDGVLEVNPMAIRILNRMDSEGKTLTGWAFRSEIDGSKELYRIEHRDELMQMENA
ncbi:MAG: hypothetical protein M3Y08_04270 [Fibrobacterota bacterium]|nr:hypothetical protein [Fibrobacterota bacterium]